MIKLERLSDQKNITNDFYETFHARNDYEIYRWCRQYLPLHIDDHAAWFEKQRKDPSIEMFGIYAAGDTLVGVCGLTDIDYINSRAEFSLYIIKRFQGKGYAKEALKELFKIGFDNLNLYLIWGETFEGNPAAKLFEKIGMKKEGARRCFYYRDGKYIDAYIYSILKREFKKCLVMK